MANPIALLRATQSPMACVRWVGHGVQGMKACMKAGCEGGARAQAGETAARVRSILTDRATFCELRPMQRAVAA
jgi:hypothetical protein